MLPITEDHWNLDQSILMPAAWATGQDEAYVFNPTMCKVAGGYALCYRVVQPNSDERRLATCLLDEDMRPVRGSAVALSDEIRFALAEDLDHRALTWHADPRYFVLDGRIYLSWNNGSAQPQNCQFLLEMDATGTRPAGLAREIVAVRDRRPIEKNWMFFETGGQTWCIYSSFPHDVMSVDLDNPDYVICKPAFVTSAVSDYETLYGVVRGGAQPVSLGDHLLVLAHSSYKMSDGLRYYACMVYEILARPPFSITRCGMVPFTLPQTQGGDGAAFSFAKLNPTVGGVVYPCGIVLEGDQALISYGVNDERAAVARLPLSAMTDLLRPVAPSLAARYEGGMLDPDQASVKTEYTPKLFWWDATDKSFDGKFGKRKFSIGNFGDIASREIVGRVGRVQTRHWVGDGVKMLAVGSILHNARNGDVIWGSGVKGTQRALHEGVQELDVRACRGPLTADVLQAHKIDMSKLTHVFDPGCLVSRLYAREIAAYDPARNGRMGNIRIIPHYRDDIFFRRMYPDHIHSFISVDETPLGMIEKMLGAEAVFSSSLHGVIFAESLGIPAYWLAPHAGEDTLKYYDYYYGTGRYNVRPYDDVRSAMKSPALPLPDFNHDAYLATFPHDRMADLSDSGLELGSSHSFAAMKPREVDEIMKVDWDEVIHKSDGLIVKAAEGRIRFLFSGHIDQDSFLTLTLGRTKGSLPRSLGVRLSAMDSWHATLDWPPRDAMDQTVELFLPAGFRGRSLDITLGCTDGRASQVVLRMAALKPATNMDWTDKANVENRQLIRQREQEKIRALYAEEKDEWRLQIAGLPESGNIRKDVRSKYVRFLSQAEFLVPRDVIDATHMIYMAGPSASSPEDLRHLACYVDGRPVPVASAYSADNKAWRVHCNLSAQTFGEGEFSRVLFEFKGAGKDRQARERSSMLIRKISFSKKGSYLSLPL